MLLSQCQIYIKSYIVCRILQDANGNLLYILLLTFITQGGMRNCLRGENTPATEELQNSNREGQTTNLLSPTLHHLSKQGDAVQVDELLGKGDVPRCVGQVLQ